MDINQIPQSSYLDILFDGRNKQYGGYELRANYTRRVRNSMVLLLGSSLVLFGYCTFISHTGKTQNQIICEPPVIKLTDVNPIELPKPIPIIPPAATTSATTRFRLPVIVNDNNPDRETIPDKDVLKESAPGTTTSIGTTGNKSKIGKSYEGIQSIPPPALPPVHSYVTEMPEANYDVTEYLNRNVNYPAFAKENNIEGRIAVQFIVSEDGSISDAKIIGHKHLGGGLEEEAIRVVAAMPQWKPGRQNGIAVKVYFVQMINFKLE